jgi:hypothetical protein
MVIHIPRKWPKFGQGGSVGINEPLRTLDTRSVTMVKYLPFTVSAVLLAGVASAQTQSQYGQVSRCKPLLRYVSHSLDVMSFAVWRHRLEWCYPLPQWLVLSGTKRLLFSMSPWSNVADNHTNNLNSGKVGC